MGAWLSETAVPLRVRRSRLCSPTCSCTTRSTRGWAGSSRPSGLSATATTSSSTPQANDKPCFVGTAIARRLAECGVKLNEQKTQIVYCQDSNRPCSTSRRRSRSWGTSLAAGCGARPARSSSASSLPSAITRRSESVERSSRWRVHRWSDVTLRRPRRRDQREGARLGQLLRALLPHGVGQAAQAHQRVPRSLGLLEVQTAASPPRESAQVPGRCLSTRARPIRSLAVRRTP